MTTAIAPAYAEPPVTDRAATPGPTPGRSWATGSRTPQSVRRPPAPEPAAGRPTGGRPAARPRAGRRRAASRAEAAPGGRPGQREADQRAGQGGARWDRHPRTAAAAAPGGGAPLAHPRRDPRLYEGPPPAHQGLLS